MRLQTDHPSVSGFVPLDAYETKRRHRQLDGAMLCARCSDLSHGLMVNAVAGQGGARMEAGLIAPSELRDQLAVVRTKKALVVKIVDATDFHGCFLNRVRDVVGANPIVLVLTKVDLLPAGTDLDALRDWVTKEVVLERKLTLARVVCVSSRRGTGMREAVGAMFAERRGRDVYVLGSANVGKSTFIRAALKAMREQGNFGVPGKRLPTASAMPGTTLGIIPLRAFEGKGAMYDTPGVFLHHRMNSILGGDDIKRFKLGASLATFECAPRVEGEAMDRASFAGLTILWGPLLRIDVRRASEAVGLTFHGPAGLRVAVVPTESLPDPSAAARRSDARRDAARAAKKLEAEKRSAEETEETEETEEEEEGARGAPSPSALAAVAEWEAARRDSPAAAAPYGSGSGAARAAKDDGDSGYDSCDGDSDSEVDGDSGSSSSDACFFHQRLVRSVSVDGAADVSVSGLNGWVRVSSVRGRDGEGSSSPGGFFEANVWGPRGLEVFVRDPMPVGTGKARAKRAGRRAGTAETRRRTVSDE